ncbi:hypothetical protein TEA_018183 [Camellia sinensis var. sinensis]|uniref:Uncharacterized protein n=1 Tax=Camellia sinensis var. sinensis TaxID=542762 RepID=A0A4S4D4X0_CAMSN|nr:hypothetical protein TEA_018183 [Camellia sinensis var. sinensis]
MEDEGSKLNLSDQRWSSGEISASSPPLFLLLFLLLSSTFFSFFLVKSDSFLVLYHWFSARPPPPPPPPHESRLDNDDTKSTSTATATATADSSSLSKSAASSAAVESLVQTLRLIHAGNTLWCKYILANHIPHIGALEAIRISCAGFPTRRMFYEFLLHFGVLSPEVLHGNYDDKVACQMILDKVGLKGHQARQRSSCELGRWLRWMRLAEVLGNAANKIQRQIHTYIARKEFISIRKAAIQLHSCWRESSLGGKAYEEEGRYEKAMEEFNSKLNGNGELKAAESGKSHFEVHDEAEQEAFLENKMLRLAGSYVGESISAFVGFSWDVRNSAFASSQEEVGILNQGSVRTRTGSTI